MKNPGGYIGEALENCMARKRINSRAKGCRIEREAAKFLTSLGFPCTRAARNGVNAGEDVIFDGCLPHISLEVKGDQAVDIGTKALADAYAQAFERKKLSTDIAAVLWRRKGGRWRLTVRSLPTAQLMTLGPDDIRAALEYANDMAAGRVA